MKPGFELGLKITGSWLRTILFPQVIDVTRDQKSVERQRTSLDPGATINGNRTRSPAGLRHSCFGGLVKGISVCRSPNFPTGRGAVALEFLW